MLDSFISKFKPFAVWVLMCIVLGLALAVGIRSCHGPRDVGTEGTGDPPAKHFGWLDRPAAVATALGEIEQSQGFKPDFSVVAKKIMAAADENQPVFFWQAEERVLKKVLESWDQGQIGSCVSHGWGRGVQDLILTQVALGGEEWPGEQVCREAIYGGCRVQVGNNGRPDNSGDGAVGAWAAQWVQEKFGGVIFYKKYPSVDLTGGYTVSRCRSWGRSGCPTDLVPVAKTHPVQGVALVRSADDIWAAVGNGYPVPVCSDVGFDSPLKDGFCARRGNWSHCMTVRGRFVHSSKGKCFVLQNSWADYLHSKGNPNSLIQVKGSAPVQLPDGCFAITWAEMGAIAQQGDSFAVSSFRGFPPQQIDWFVRRDPPIVLRRSIFARLNAERFSHAICN